MSRVSAPRLGGVAAAGALVLGCVAAAIIGAIGSDLVAGRTSGPELSEALDVLRACAAAVLLFAVCGLAPARLLAPPELRRWAPLLAIPLGACVAGLALALLGALEVPLEASLVVVLAAGVGAALWTGGSDVALAARLRQLAGPALIAALVVAVLVAPLIRTGSLASVVGGNGDAHLATGVAELLQQAPPGAERVQLPIDHMPSVWNSRYPMIYVLAATSQLSGLDPIVVLTPLSAVLMAGVAIGLFLIGLLLLGAGPRGSLLVMAMGGLGTGAMSVVYEPFYNLQWALLTLPLVLLAGWYHLRDPRPRTLALFGIAAVSSVLAYPLLFPFVALFLAAVAWRARDRRRKWLPVRRLPRRRWVRALLVLPALFVALVALLLVAAAAQKMISALIALAPGGDLSEWHTPGDPFPPLYDRFGLPESLAVAVVLLFGLAAVGLWKAPKAARAPFGVLFGALLLTVSYMRLRDGTQLFYLRAVSILGPLTLAFAGAGIAWLVRARSRRMLPGLAVAAVALALVGFASAQRAHYTVPSVDRELWQVRDWGKRLPPGSSVRVDIRPYGAQQWAGYMLAPHPLTALDPLRKFFPYPPVGRRADYLITNRYFSSRDVEGAPLFREPRASPSIACGPTPRGPTARRSSWWTRSRAPTPRAPTRRARAGAACGRSAPSGGASPAARRDGAVPPGRPAAAAATSR